MTTKKPTTPAAQEKPTWQELEDFVFNYFENCSADGMLSIYNDITNSRLTMEDFEDEE